MRRTALCALRPLLFPLVVIFSTTVSQGRAAESETINALEKKLFDPVLSSENIDRLLEELLDPKQRKVAEQKLIAEGQGHQARIVKYAATCGVDSSCSPQTGDFAASHRSADRRRRPVLLSLRLQEWRKNEK